jgi:hypothetical protein
MKSYSEFIGPGSALVLPVGGRVLYIQRSAAGPVLDIEFQRSQAGYQTVERVGKGFKAAPVGGFEGIKIRAAVGGVVDFVITDGDIQIAFDEDMTTIGNDDGQSIPIRTVQGSPLEVLFAGTIAPVFGELTNTDASAVPMRQKAGASFTVEARRLTEIVDYVPVAVGLAALLLVSDATLHRLRVRNGHASARVALGGPAVTMANAVVILEPGDIWIENDAPGAPWYAISDTAATSVKVQGLK